MEGWVDGQVMGPLVENLEQLGYVYGDNLLAAGVPPHYPAQTPGEGR